MLLACSAIVECFVGSRPEEHDEIALDVVVMIGMDELADMRDGRGMRDVDAMAVRSPSALSPVGRTTD
jgi:hypothetical protein